MMIRHLSACALLITSASLLVSDVACAQAQGSNERDIVERAPNIIRKTGPYGSEMMIDGESIVERTPCRPAYPQSSIKNGEIGTVVFQLMINESGFANRAKIVESWIDMRYVWEIK